MYFIDCQTLNKHPNTYIIDQIKIEFNNLFFSYLDLV